MSLPQNPPRSVAGLFSETAILLTEILHSHREAQIAAIDRGDYAMADRHAAVLSMLTRRPVDAAPIPDMPQAIIRRIR
jgi:hypothetical protein